MLAGSLPGFMRREMEYQMLLSSRCPLTIHPRLRPASPAHPGAMPYTHTSPSSGRGTADSPGAAGYCQALFDYTQPFRRCRPA